MNLKSASGFTLVELIVVVIVLFGLASVLIPCTSNAPLQANMTAVGTRGRDIYVAIEGANTEREALGLPPIWPRDFDAAVDTNAEELARLDFKNSTDYFRWLHDANLGNTTNGSHRAEGFNYFKLAGAGVPKCADGQPLSAANNMWIVAKNVRPDMGDIVPVLVTRNIDASSLAASMTDRDFKKTMRFDPTWGKPFSDKGFVLVRKGGAIFKPRPKYMSWRVVYMNQAFDTTRTQDGQVAPPLKYLTPTREVVLGDKAYENGAAIAYRMAGGWWGQFKRTANHAGEGLLPALRVAIFLAPVYLVCFVRGHTNRKKEGLLPPTSRPVMCVWICHFLAVTFYVVGSVGAAGDESWVYAVAAFVAQAVGVGLVLVFQRHDRETRRRQIKWLLVPLWVVLVCTVLLAFLMAT